MLIINYATPGLEDRRTVLENSSNERLGMETELLC